MRASRLYLLHRRYLGAIPCRSGPVRISKSASKITEREKVYAGALSKLQGDFGKMEALLEKQPLDYVAIDAGGLSCAVVQQHSNGPKSVVEGL